MPACRPAMPRLRRRRRLRSARCGRRRGRVMWLYALVIMFSRVVVLAHHPSDVIAGALVGAVGALWCAAGLRRGAWCFPRRDLKALSGAFVAAGQGGTARAFCRHKSLRIPECRRLNPVGMRFRSFRHVVKTMRERDPEPPAYPWSCRCATKPAISRRWSPRSPPLCATARSRSSMSMTARPTRPRRNCAA